MLLSLQKPLCREVSCTSLISMHTDVIGCQVQWICYPEAFASESWNNGGWLTEDFRPDFLMGVYLLNVIDMYLVLDQNTCDKPVLIPTSCRYRNIDRFLGIYLYIGWRVLQRQEHVPVPSAVRIAGSYLNKN